MPEGDTIWKTATAIQNRVGGLTCTSAEPEEFHRLKGQTLTRVEAYGKHLHMRFDSGVSLHSHMRMNGSWHLYRRGQPWRKPRWQAKAVLEFGEHVAVVFSAPIVEIVRSEGTTAHLGPDILADPFDLDVVIQNAREATAPTIGELLLDQRVSAGIGNIYKCESLWELRINPWASPTRLDDAALRRVYEVARRRMRESTVGGIVHQPHAAHARSGQPCPRCFTRVQVRPQGEQGRLTYWCPRCQAVPTSDPLTSL